MKAIICASVHHHGNTKKILDAIAKECEVELIDATRASSKHLLRLWDLGIVTIKTPQEVHIHDEGKNGKKEYSRIH